MWRQSQRKRLVSSRRETWLRAAVLSTILRRNTAAVVVAVALHLGLAGSAAASIDTAPPRTAFIGGITLAAPAAAPSRAGGTVERLADSATDHPLTRLRELYYAAVEDRAAITAALKEIEALRDAGMARTGSRRAAVLDAYVGALTTLRAKHGRWPPDRLRNLNDGLTLLDRAVQDAPEVVEIRYLRLMSCYYLPGILGRGSSVQDDFAALTRLLPEASDEFPPHLYRAIVTFVVEHGDLDPADRAALQSAIRTSHSDAG